MTKKFSLITLLVIIAALIPEKIQAGNTLTETTLHCSVSQEKISLEGFKDGNDAVYLTLAQENIGNLCICLGGILTEQKEQKAFSINKDGKNTIIALSETDDSVRSITRKNKDQVLLIKMDRLLELLGGHVTRDDSSDLYYIQPVISQITAQEENNELMVKIIAASNIRYITRNVQSPQGIVITIDDVYLDPSMKTPDNPLLSGMIIERIATKPGSVSITIPQDNEKTVTVQPRILPQQVVVKIRKNNAISADKTDSTVRLQNITVEDTKNYVKILVTTSAPFDYRWKRLQQPDNRFFIDFLYTTLEAPCTAFKPENCLVDQIRVAQLQPGLEGITRLVLDLTHPAECEIITDYDNPNQVIIKVRNQLINPENSMYSGFGSTTLNPGGLGQIICIDPGHGGSDRGAYNHNMGLAEKDVTLDISLRLAEILKKRGYTPVLTRTTDRDVTYAGSPDRDELAARNTIAEKRNASLFISIHINASVNGSANGISTHWYKSKDRDLAEEIQLQLVNKTGRKDRGIARDRFFVLRNTELPSVLVEAGFISNQEEAALLCNDEYRQRIAESIAEGLGVYISKYMNKRLTIGIGGGSRK